MVYKMETLDTEIRKIKTNYCSKCEFFEGKCTKNKIYKKCLRKNERVLKSREEK